MSLTPYATAASHSMTSPLSWALNEIGFVRVVAMALGVRRGADHASAPEGGGQHAHVEDRRSSG